MFASDPVPHLADTRIAYRLLSITTPRCHGGEPRRSEASTTSSPSVTNVSELGSDALQGKKEGAINMMTPNVPYVRLWS